MIENHFQKKRAEYMANPDDSKLDELHVAYCRYLQQAISVLKDEGKME